MEEKPSYYAIIPATVRYDEDLIPHAKLLYGEITALSNKEGYCYATNKYFAKLYQVHWTTISRWIKDLQDKKYISVEVLYKGDTKEIEKRIIKISDTYYQNCYGGISKNANRGISKNAKDNNTSINNTRINNSKPTLEEVKEYCKERNNNVDPNKFYDYYSVNNWIDNKGNKVRNWKQKLITWEKHSPDNVELPDWFNKDIKANATLEEQEEMKNILKEFK